ncbi:MAG TPA: tryptophan synthase subunit alpha [Defluviitoga sp.]|nr:tryptophan synthase subunit alpha [Defluviitoga sp.]HPZ29748.1 tryptophan synthase subunit alpha [Defluviitoga sp.]HQD63435.1 tryptophan synthase subunit alpha [Defluviitoga sp.]
MSKIQKIFDNKKALITYITAGDPDLETTKDIILELNKAGVDIIEIGIPFSDPLADGPVIQEASQRAIKKGITLSKIFNTLESIKGRINTPLVLMGYYNSILSYGSDKFIEDCKLAGVSGVIIPDLPFDEEPEFYEELKENDIDGILLVAPNTSEERLKELSKHATGFLYCVSLMGVTGDSRGPVEYINEYVQKIRKYVDIPIAIGFGIDTPEKVKHIINYVDGIIVGSALIKIIDQNKENKIKMFNEIHTFVQNLKVW